MIAPIKEHDKIITEISKVFQAVRDSRIGQPRYPLEARKLAVSAIKHGHSAADVAKAAGVSRGAITNWQIRDENRAEGLRAIHLKLVKSRKQDRQPKEARIKGNEQKATARIHFRSGATLEIAAEALTASLIAALNGGAQ